MSDGTGFTDPRQAFTATAQGETPSHVHPDEDHYAEFLDIASAGDAAAKLKLAAYPELHKYPDLVLILALDKDASISTAVSEGLVTNAILHIIQQDSAQESQRRQTTLLLKSNFLERYPRAVLELWDTSHLQDLFSKNLLNRIVAVAFKSTDRKTKVSLAKSGLLDGHAKIVSTLASDEDWLVRRALARNKILKNYLATTFALSQDPNPQVTLALSTNGPALAACTPATFKLLQSTEPRVRELVEKNAEALSTYPPEKYMEHISRGKEDKDKWRARREFAGDKKLLPKLPAFIEWLAKDDSVYVRQVLAANSDALIASKNTLMALANDDSVYVRQILSKNERAFKAHPIAILELLNSPHQEIRETAEKLLNEELVLKITADPDPAVAGLVAHNCRLLRDYPRAIHSLREHPNQYIRTVLADVLLSREMEISVRALESANEAHLLKQFKNIGREINRTELARDSSMSPEMADGPA